VTADLRIVEDDLSGEPIKALLRSHLEEMHRLTPPESVHAMPIERLREPDVTFFTAWRGENLAGCGAIRRLDATHGEIKAMRVAPEFRGEGVGKAILLRLFAEARRRGYARLSLETGAPEAFLPARRLFGRLGFRECPPFADYREDPYSVFMRKDL
jgi:putative acetyltransferase